MQDSLLPNGHLVGTGEASRQSLSQSPVLGRHGNKQRGARQMGERSQREAGRCTIISDPVTRSGHDTQPCGHPVCFTGQWTQSMLCSPVPLTQTGSIPLTHTASHTPTYTYIFSHKYTQSPTLLKHASHTLTHPHILLTHPHTPLTHCSHTPHTHIHTLHTLTHTNT